MIPILEYTINEVVGKRKIVASKRVKHCMNIQGRFFLCTQHRQVIYGRKNQGEGREMTQEIFLTNLKDINGLKVVCGKCQGAFMIPVREPKTPLGCPFCKKPLNLDKNYIKSFLQMLLQMREIKDKDFSFYIESEKQ
jgi:hypothetical protein